MYLCIFSVIIFSELLLAVSIIVLMFLILTERNSLVFIYTCAFGLLVLRLVVCLHVHLLSYVPSPSTVILMI